MLAPFGVSLAQRVRSRPPPRWPHSPRPAAGNFQRPRHRLHDCGLRISGLVVWWTAKVG